MKIGNFETYSGKSSKKLQDLTNQKIGRLTILARGQNLNNHPAWICQCDCGNIVLVRSNNLLKNTTKSCGCWRKDMPKETQRLDITNKKFGYLTAICIDEEKSDINNGTFWICKCDCGNNVSVSLNHLQRGAARSCGCMKSSFGENYIEDLLKAKDVKYIKEYSFDNFVTKKGYKYRYDFYLPELNILIEYDGEQHYKESNYFKSSLEEIQNNDAVKNEYALKNKIKLYRIPYKDINSLTVIDIFNEKYLVKN